MAKSQPTPLEPGGGGICILVKGNANAADLRSSWFSSPIDDDHSDDREPDSGLQGFAAVVIFNYKIPAFSKKVACLDDCFRHGPKFLFSEPRFVLGQVSQRLDRHPLRRFA